MKSIQFSRNRAHGTVGCTVGLAPHLYVGAFGGSPADALSQAGQLAAQIQSLADAHPEVAAALKLVPGGAPALLAISAAAKLYQSDLSAKDVANAVGPKVANVVASILKLF